MLDEDVDLELLAFLRQHLRKKSDVHADPETDVLQDAEFVYDNSIDVAIPMAQTKAAAARIYAQMKRQGYSTATWSAHELHPKVASPQTPEALERTVAFIFTMDLLNFSFWSELPEDKRFAVAYRDKTWTGYWSLVAGLQRGLEEGHPITSPDWWYDDDGCSLECLEHIFRSTTDEEMPMLKERLDCLQEAGAVLCERYDGKVTNLIRSANGSAAGLVNLLAREFSCFRDEAVFPGRRKPVRFLKRAQILVADIWACFDGQDIIGAFRDIDKITMFADYRVPQILTTMGCLYCSPSLSAAVADKQLLESGGKWEMQLRACSIWCVELIRREIKRNYPDTHVNAILIDFFLYDTIKEMEAAGQPTIEHHRTRSIWY